MAQWPHEWNQICKSETGFLPCGNMSERHNKLQMLQSWARNKLVQEPQPCQTTTMDENRWWFRLGLFFIKPHQVHPAVCYLGNMPEVFIVQLKIWTQVEQWFAFRYCFIRVGRPMNRIIKQSILLHATCQILDKQRCSRWFYAEFPTASLWGLSYKEEFTQNTV